MGDPLTLSTPVPTMEKNGRREKSGSCGRRWRERTDGLWAATDGGSPLSTGGGGGWRLVLGIQVCLGWGSLIVVGL